MSNGGVCITMTQITRQLNRETSGNDATNRRRLSRCRRDSSEGIGCQTAEILGAFLPTTGENTNMTQTKLKKFCAR